MRNHFACRHWNDSVHILEEHPDPYPKCPRCGLQLPASRLNNAHFTTATCLQGMERQRRRAAFVRSYEARDVVFTVADAPLERVSTFKYLGRVIAMNNSDWPALFHNLKKARQRWAMVSKVLDKQGASMRCRGLFYKAVVQSVLLYGCETWVVKEGMLKVLEGFHHRVARRITGRTARRLPNGEWRYPCVKKALRKAGLWSMREYIRRRQARMVEYLATRPIYDLCREIEALPGSARTMRWWEQDFEPAGEDLEGGDESDSSTTTDGSGGE